MSRIIPGRRGLTSEKAGAHIFRYFFHSSCSEAIIFGPKKRTPLYKWAGFGKRDLEEVTSYDNSQISADLMKGSATNFDRLSIRKIKHNFRRREHADLE